MADNTKNNKDLIERLKDSKEADAYFSSILEQCKNLDKKDADTLLHESLKNIAETRPEDVNIDINNENSFKMRALLRLLNFVSKKLI